MHRVSKEIQPPGVWAVSSISLSILSVALCCVSMLYSFIKWPLLGMLFVTPLAFAPIAVGLAIVGLVLRERGAILAICVSSLMAGIYTAMMFVLYFLT